MIKKEKINSLVIDTGVFIEYLSNTPIGKCFKEKFLFDKNIKFYYISPLVYTELLYIFCRKMGMKKAIELLSIKLKHLIVLDEQKLRIEASNLKCDFGIALSDCYSIAAGKLQSCPVLMKKEQELEKIDITKFDSKLIFIDNFL